MATKVSATDLVKSGWEYFSKHIGQLWPAAVLLAIPAILSSFSNQRQEAAKRTFENFSDWSSYIESATGVSVATLGFTALLFLIVAIVYNAVVYSGVTKQLLSSLRGHSADLGVSAVVNSGSQYLGKFIIMSILVGAIVFLGFLLLIVPGLIAIFLLSLSIQFLVDKNLSPTDAISASFRLVKDNAGQVLMVYLVTFVVVILVSIVSGIVFGADIWLMRALAAIVQGFVSLFLLVVASQLYLSLTGAKASKAKAE